MTDTSNWLSTDINWPSAKTLKISFFLSLTFHLVRIPGSILMIVITLMKTDIHIVLHLWLFFFFWVALWSVLSLPKNKKRETDWKIILILLEMDSHMHTEWFCTWPSLAVSRLDFFPPHFFPSLAWKRLFTEFIFPLFFIADHIPHFSHKCNL